MEVCAERDAIARHIVLTLGRGDEMRRIERLRCLLACQDAAVLVEAENHGPKRFLPHRTAIVVAWAFARCSEIERYPLALKFCAIRTHPLVVPAFVSLPENNSVRRPVVGVVEAQFLGEFDDFRVLLFVVGDFDAHFVGEIAFVAAGVNEVFDQLVVVLRPDRLNPGELSGELWNVIESIDVEPVVVLYFVDLSAALVRGPDDLDPLRLRHGGDVSYMLPASVPSRGRGYLHCGKSAPHRPARSASRDRIHILDRVHKQSVT